jgi:molybdopterin synthase catalytic subunit
MSMEIKVHYLGSLPQRLSRSDEIAKVPEGATLESLVSQLLERNPPLRELSSALAMAVNEVNVPSNRRLKEGDKVTIIPPASAGGPYCRLTNEPLQLQEVIDAVYGPGAVGQGGIATFTGVVRDHNQGKKVVRLHYEAYPPMVLSTLTSIIARIEGSIPGAKVAIVHRDGTLEIGDVAVVIAASAPHRAEAFDACRQAIELLKQDVPIWKKEVSPTGEEWIGMRP